MVLPTKVRWRVPPLYLGSGRGQEAVGQIRQVGTQEKQARVDGGVSDSEEEYHQETQEESQIQRPHSRKSRAKSTEPQHRLKETDKCRLKSHRYHPRPPDAPLYRPRAWAPPSPPRNPTKPVQEPIRRPNPWHNLPNKPKRLILDDGSPVSGRAVGLPKVTIAPSPSRKGDTSHEGEPETIRHRLALRMGNAGSSEPDFNFH